jgi:5-methylcytosine-specific restriction endonuclease McrA
VTLVLDRVCTRPFTPGRCHTCGGPVEGEKRLFYCSKTCRKIYWSNHFWREAREEALRRANSQCVICGYPAEEVHHIIPLNGVYRHGSCLNHQENLIALCHRCHHPGPEDEEEPMPAGAPLFDLEPYVVGV